MSAIAPAANAMPPISDHMRKCRRIDGPRIASVVTCWTKRGSGATFEIARRITSSSVGGHLGYHQRVSVDFKPPARERQPRLEHVRDLWQMHRPQRPRAT